MSAYLQRLAASAARASPVLHPMVGSLYGGRPRHDGHGDTPQLDFAPTTTAAAPAAPSLDAAAGRGGGSFAPLMPSPGEARSTPYHAPIDPPHTADALPASEPTARTMASAVDAATSDATRPAPPVTQPASGTAPAPRAVTAMSPSRLAPLPGTLPPTGAPAVSPSASNASRRLQATPPAMRHPVAPEPADIEIHIGRIDVVAQPRTVVRPSAPSARQPTATSLDAYLKRHDRGSG